MASAAVCFDAAVGRAVLAKGVPVVLCGPDGDDLSRSSASLRPGGRVALFIGRPADDAAVVAALAMASELFGHGAEVVPAGPDVGPVPVRRRPDEPNPDEVAWEAPGK